MFLAHGVTIIVVNDRNADKSVQEELEEDIAKAEKFDELLTELESREDTEMISCAELKKRME